MQKLTFQRTIKYLFFAFSGLVLYMSFRAMVHHDYAAYSDQWALIIEGSDPWLLPDGNTTGNAYGPLYNLLSLLYAVHPQLPRALFALTWLLAGAYLYRQIDPGGPAYRSQALLVVWFIFLNPYFFLSTVFYGQFDILVAALCFAAVIACLKGRDAASGILLGLAFLLKLYPVVILPALVLVGFKVRWRLLLGFGITVSVALGAAYLVWGGSIVEPFSFASERESSAFSIFYYLRGIYSPVNEVGSVDWLSLPLMAAGLLLLLGIHVGKRLDPLPSAILFFFVALVFYKVGHSQFYTALFFLLPYWFITDPDLSGKHLLLKSTALMPLVYISSIVSIYYLTDEFSGEWVKMLHAIGLPAFILTAAAIVALLGYLLRRPTGPIEDRTAPEQGLKASRNQASS